MLRRREGNRRTGRSAQTRAEREVLFCSNRGEHKEIAQNMGQPELGSNPAQAKPTDSLPQPVRKSLLTVLE